jgi:NTP pyrophosphatase (non-canonical NTP hydrolase)
MKFKSFSAVNRRRCEHPDGFNHAIGSWSGSDWMTALVGEIGEAANLIKKLNRSRDGVPGNKQTDEVLHTNLALELGDAFIYLDLIAQRYGIDIGEAARRVFNSKSKEIGYPVLINSHGAAYDTESPDGFNACVEATEAYVGPPVEEPPSLYHGQDDTADRDGETPSVDTGLDTFVTIGCYRETSRLDRMQRTFRRAHAAAHSLDAQRGREFAEALGSLHDRKGGLTVRWHTREGFKAFHALVNTAWSDEGESLVTHLLLNPGGRFPFWLGGVSPDEFGIDAYDGRASV